MDRVECFCAAPGSGMDIQTYGLQNTENTANSFLTHQVPDNGIAWNGYQHKNFNRFPLDYNIPYQNYNVPENLATYSTMAYSIDRGLREESADTLRHGVQLSDGSIEEQEPMNGLPNSILEPNLQTSPKGIDFFSLLDDIESIDLVGNILPNSDRNDNGTERPYAQSLLDETLNEESLTTPRIHSPHYPTIPVLFSLTEPRESQEEAPSEDKTQKAVHEGINRKDVSEKRKLNSAKGAEEDTILNEFLTKRVYNRTLMRPKPKRAPKTFATDNNTECPKKSEKNSSPTSTKISMVQDDTLDLSKFTRENTGGNRNIVSQKINPGKDDVLNDFVLRKYTKTLVKPPRRRETATSLEVGKKELDANGISMAKESKRLQRKPYAEILLDNSNKCEKQINKDKIHNETVKYSDTKRKRSDGVEICDISNKRRRALKRERKNSKDARATRCGKENQERTALSTYTSQRTSLKKSWDPLEKYYSPISPASPVENTEPFRIPNSPERNNHDRYKFAIDSRDRPTGPTNPRDNTKSHLRSDEGDYSWIDKFEQLVPDEYLLFASGNSKP